MQVRDMPVTKGDGARVVPTPPSDDKPVRRVQNNFAICGALLAISGRIIVAPMLLLVFVAQTDYLTTGKAFLTSGDSFFDFVKEDPIMRGGCTGCGLGCDRTLLLLSKFGTTALMSKPPYQDMFITDSSNVNRLGPEGLALAHSISSNNKSDCLAGINRWGSQLLAVVGTPKEVLDVVYFLNLSVGPQVMKEVTLAADPATAVCDTRWALESKTRMFAFRSTVSGGNYSYMSAPDFTISPEDTECRPHASNDGIVREMLALDTHGEDLVADVPAAAKIFPYSFRSSLPEASRDYAIKNAINGATRVSQPLFHAYYGACRVRAVNRSGVFIEDGCELVDHWLPYGLMLQVPDDVPVCSTGQDAVCVHNVYNSRWEFLTKRESGSPMSFKMVVNSFRQRYTDSVPLSRLPGTVLLQMLIMGFLSLYQIMAHRRSVLLTQIWAYRCQNGHMQVVYLAQVTYHLAYNSDAYYLGLITGTLSVESLGNLVICFFVFSYCTINMIKARAGDQRLDRYYRLTWEAMQPLVIAGAAVLLFGGAYRKPLIFILDANGELLRKTTQRGRDTCNLSDSCVIFRFNLVVLIAAATIVLGLVAAGTSVVARRLSSAATAHRRKTLLVIGPAERSLSEGSNDRLAAAAIVPAPAPSAKSVSSVRPAAAVKNPDVTTTKVVPFDEELEESPAPDLTSFERHCLGNQLEALFHDCGDIAYVSFRGRRSTSVEAILLAGFVFHDDYVYRANGLVLLIIGRWMPQRLLLTFNLLFTRWRVDEAAAEVAAGSSCPWHQACAGSSRSTGAIPLA